VIFVDSSFWIGLSDESDDRHPLALGVLHGHSATPLLTTNHVVGETWTFLRRRHSHLVASRFFDRASRTRRLEIAFVAEDVERRAWTWLGQHDERAYSFVDATSFALMERLRIRDAFAFDGDFSAAGFVELRP
jgi:uncharacterized protein